MYITKCVDSFAEVAAQGPELAFVVYPDGRAIISIFFTCSYLTSYTIECITGLSLMGAASPIFSALFFIMMLALGFGSEVRFRRIFTKLGKKLFKFFVTQK
jgi:hypothetical protein